MICLFLVYCPTLNFLPILKIALHILKKKAFSACQPRPCNQALLHCYRVNSKTEAFFKFAFSIKSLIRHEALYFLFPPSNKMFKNVKYDLPTLNVFGLQQNPETNILFVFSL